MLNKQSAMKKNILTIAVSGALASLMMSSQAQVIPEGTPDAGRISRESGSGKELEKKKNNVKIDIPSPSTAVPADGATVIVRSVQLSGNTLFSTEELLKILGSVEGESYTLAGMRSLADRITDYYRAKGYPFTQTLIPQQELTQNILRINVIEGKYGKAVTVSSNADIAVGSQQFLASLESGKMIDNGSLERASLILDDQPGMAVKPIIRPGQDFGTGDLSMRVERDSYYDGALTYDNQGGRYTGQHRARVDLNVNSPFMFGDRVTLRGLHSNQQMWLGSMDYDMPLNGSGLRAGIGYAHTNYQLGEPFKVLEAHGFAKTTSAKLSYPLIRSQALNVYSSLTYMHKRLEDRYDLYGYVTNKSSDSWPVVIQFDQRDAFAGGGITYGAVTMTNGKLNLDDNLLLQDQLSANAAGHYKKYNFDLARIQRVSEDFSLYGKYSKQWANKNLDSSEGFSAGGMYGVRAYPTSEAYGNKGYLMQVELRYLMGEATMFTFYDQAKTHTNQNPWSESSARSRTLAGWGIGSRYETKVWTVDGTVAWRTKGGDVTSEDRNRNPRLNLLAAYKF